MATFAEAAGAGAGVSMPTIENHTIQSFSGQDYSWFGHDDNKTWLIALDGHGKHHSDDIPDVDLIAWLREFNWAKLMQNRDDKNPIICLEEQISSLFKSTRGIGAALSITEIIDNTKVTIWWKGDAATKILRCNSDGEIDIVASTELPSKEDEVARFTEMGQSIPYEDGWQVSAISESELTMRPNGIYIFTCVDKMNMSQAIGHDGLTGIVDQSLEYNLEEQYAYRIIGASDGIWDISALENKDVLNKFWNSSAEELVTWAVSQWYRKWVYIWGDTKVVDQQIGDCDDVTCVVWSRALV